MKKKNKHSRIIVGLPAGPYDHLVGGNVFIRTVTHHYCGKLEKVFPQELLLRDAAWVASDGRFADMFKTLAADEVEPFPDGLIVVGRGAVIDVAKWTGPVLRSQK